MYEQPIELALVEIGLLKTLLNCKTPIDNTYQLR